MHFEAGTCRWWVLCVSVSVSSANDPGCLLFGILLPTKHDRFQLLGYERFRPLNGLLALTQERRTILADNQFPYLEESWSFLYASNACVNSLITP